ncbi:hypothetical protein APHAL10511_008692 [Amanita phalloides]|nr:hypothetical protein APHAL10511_008692 [Amanita phalloides]
MDVDPSGILAALAGDDFFHGEQNVVKYYNRKIVQGGAVKYEAIAPVRFRVGDIVEAKATLMLVPIREGRFKLTAVLRSLTLLDTSFAQTSAHASNMRIKKLMQAPTTPTLKRTITYAEDEETSTAPKKKPTSSDLGSNSLSGVGMERPYGSTPNAQKASRQPQTEGSQTTEKDKGKSADIDGEKEADEPMVVDN